MSVLKLHEENIVDGELTIGENDYDVMNINNNLISIVPKYKIEGDIFIFYISKDINSYVSSQVNNGVISIFGLYQIPGAWSNKDDEKGLKLIKNILPDGKAYKAMVFPSENEYATEVAIFVVPEESCRIS
jgi:hypothetical protein